MYNTKYWKSYINSWPDYGPWDLGISKNNSVNYSNTDHLYSQWLSSVIYWYTDWARAGMMSFGRQFDFHDVIYYIQPCNVDNRRYNVKFTTNEL